jgi:N-acetylglucosaminyldiphosphoundecaprenol N-acetyl-beta-D-mannosaminyltransferase
MGSLRPRLEEPIGKPVILMAVGGAFDMLAGKIPRAPKLVQQMGFEWLWRLFQEPWRWKRQLAIFEFLWLMLIGKNNSL